MGWGRLGAGVVQKFLLPQSSSFYSLELPHNDGNMTKLCLSRCPWPSPQPQLIYTCLQGVAELAELGMGTGKKEKKKKRKEISTGYEPRNPCGPVASLAGCWLMSTAWLGTLPGSLLFSFWPEIQDAGCEDEGRI